MAAPTSTSGKVCASTTMRARANKKHKQSRARVNANSLPGRPPVGDDQSQAPIEYCAEASAPTRTFNSECQDGRLTGVKSERGDERRRKTRGQGRNEPGKHRAVTQITD